MRRVAGRSEAVGYAKACLKRSDQTYLGGVPDRPLTFKSVPFEMNFNRSNNGDQNEFSYASASRNARL
jgi:hypothetical protein